jgi:hypothetical protein
MSNWLAASGKLGGILVIIALVITLLKQIIGFIGFLTAIIKIGIILGFVVLLIGVGLLVLKSWKSSAPKED